MNVQRHYVHVSDLLDEGGSDGNGGQLWEMVRYEDYARLEKKLAEIRALPTIPMLDDMDEQYGEALELLKVRAILDREA